MNQFNIYFICENGYSKKRSDRVTLHRYVREVADEEQRNTTAIKAQFPDKILFCIVRIRFQLNCCLPSAAQSFLFSGTNQPADLFS
jgi:hypothetical protein